MQVCLVNACEHYRCTHSLLEDLPRKRVQINDTDRGILHAGREIGNPTENLIIYIHRSPRMWGFPMPPFPKGPPNVGAQYFKCFKITTFSIHESQKPFIIAKKLALFII